MVGGRQVVSLGPGCAHRSVILHELGHVLGFWHEQNRPDRDKFVRINKENIIKSTLYGSRQLAMSRFLSNVTTGGNVN